MPNPGRFYAQVLHGSRIVIYGRRYRLEEALHGRERYILYGTFYPSVTMMNFLRMIVKHRRVMSREFSCARSRL